MYSGQGHSFELSDVNLGDIFEIELYTDPVYQVGSYNYA